MPYNYSVDISMVAQNYVLRSVYLEPEIDNFLREQAFNLSVSKNDLIRRYVLFGAKQELDQALNSPPTSEARRALSTGVIRAARGEGILSMNKSRKLVATDSNMQTGLSSKKKRLPKNSKENSETM
jgi:hypothetical protein